LKECDLLTKSSKPDNATPSISRNTVMSDPLSGTALYRDIERYAGFGVHRYGSRGAEAAMSWIELELGAAGYQVDSQALTILRQYELDHAHLHIGEAVLEAFPHWWLPENRATFALSARLSDEVDATGKLAWVHLPHDRSAYLNDAHRSAIYQAAAHNPVAIVLTIDNPANDIFTYNANQEDPPWPVPVIVVAARHKALLAKALNDGTVISIDVAGRYLRDVPGRNLIGRLDGSESQAIVISTPVTSWFTSSGERGPGIANFLALARHAARQASDRPLGKTLVFVATAGHEIGHGGMERFLHQAAPPPSEVKAWIHLGASNACHLWTQDGEGWRTDGLVDGSSRRLVMSPSMQAMVSHQFRHLEAVPFIAEKEAIGELRDVKAAGYRDFFGMAGSHRFFHTPTDGPQTTSPAILEPVARAFASALDALM
jgi:hypothetical protein